MQFKREILTQELVSEMIPLLVLHYGEIAHYKDIPLDPDYDQYIKLENAGVLRAFTARDESNALIGYALFFIKSNIHYKSSLQALQDILFVRPDKRGIGFRFIPWCDEMLRAENIQVVYHHVKEKHNFGKLLSKIGYELVDLIYARRLD